MAKTSKFTSDERTFAILAHISALFLGFLGPLLFYFIKNDGSEYVKGNIRHALNFQISMIIYVIISLVLCLVLIGFLLLALLGLFNLVVVIIAAIKAADGEVYKYPLEIEFIK